MSSSSASFIVNLYNKFKVFATTNRLASTTLASLFLALFLGTICKWSIWGDSDEPIDPFVLRYLNLPGLIYIRLFMILIVPLLVTSLSTSFLNEEHESESGNQPNHQDNGNNRNSTGLWITEDLRKHSIEPNLQSESIDPKRLLLTTFAFVTSFSSFTVTLGIVLVSLFGPGRGGSTDHHSTGENTIGARHVAPTANISLDDIGRIEDIQQKHLKAGKTVDSIYNIVLNIFPDNLVSTLFATQYSKSTVVWPVNKTEILDSNYVPTLQTEIVTSKAVNMLGLCVISLALGLILQNLGLEKTRTIRSLLHEANSIVFYTMNCLMKIMPVGIFFWMFVEALKMRSMSQVALHLVQFALVAILAFSIVLFVFYPLVYYIFVRDRNPYALYGNIGSAILVAVGSCSSAITLPMTMKCMQENAGLNRQIAQFVLPLGMTVHMNGTAMYIPMVAIFVGQFKGIQMDLSSLVILGIFSLVMSMGLPASGGGGPMVMMAAGSIIGIDDIQDMIVYFLTFDWIFERIRTSTNIIGDCFVSKCIERWLIAIGPPSDPNRNEIS